MNSKNEELRETNEAVIRKGTMNLTREQKLALALKARNLAAIRRAKEAILKSNK